MRSRPFAINEGIAYFKRKHLFRLKCNIAAVTFGVLISIITSSAIWSSNGLLTQMINRCSVCGRLGAENVHRITLGPDGEFYYNCQSKEKAPLFMPPTDNR